MRVPIDEPLVAVDEALAVKLHEDAAHRRRQTLVHGEALAAPIGRSAERAELAGDGAAQLRLPLPDPRDERVAPESVAIETFRFELALDHHLRGDPGVIGAGLP